jgi:hypothetical protein
MITVYGKGNMNIKIEDDKATLFIDNQRIVTASMYDPDKFGRLKEAVEKAL